MINESIHIDCNTYLKRFRKKTFNLIVADPPYFNGPETRGYYGKKKYKNQNIKRRDYPVIDTWELPDEAWFKRVKRAGEHIIIWGANYFDFLGPVHKTPRRNEIMKWLNDHPTGWIVWDKCNGKSSFNQFELAWTNIDMPTVIYRFMWNGMNQGKNIFEGHIMQGNKKLNQIRIHTTEKPIFLYKWLFYKFALPGFKILDTHLGSGSSRIAAYDMGFDFYGCEKHEVIFNDQEKRFAKYKSKNENQTKLFA